MPLHILLILVIGGIAGIALALHILGLSQTLHLDMVNARQQWLRHFPDDSFDTSEAIDCLVTIRGDRALVRSDQSYGLVWTMGADASARRLVGAQWAKTSNGVAVRFPDPAAPRIEIRLAEAETHLWHSYLEKFHGL